MSNASASIFNDVIGPVMRGPSSSHVAGAARIGSLIRMSSSSKITKVVVEFDTNGSLAESYDGHGSDIGFVSGILGIELTDPNVTHALKIAKERNVDIIFNILDYGAVHPNNYRMIVTNENNEVHTWEAISVGGGMVEIEKLDGFEVSICGDFYEVLLLVNAENLNNIVESVKEIVISYEYVNTSTKDGKSIINIKTSKEVEVSKISALSSIPQVTETIVLKPILTTISSATCKVPFSNAAQLLEYSKTDNREMWQLAALYESKRGNTTEQEVFKKMSDLLYIMKNCVKEGLSGTTFKDRILGPQANLIEKGMKNNTLIPVTLLNNVIKCITAIMEVKSSMGVIIAAPTAGSCGCLPGTIIGVGETLEISDDDMTKALLVAGLIGVFITEGATFAAEVAGCQVECGAGSAMAAAGLSQMFGGTVEQCIDAASMAMQNITGLACDPVANRVEVPCLGKNVMGGSNAISSATMALAGYDKIIPLDETIESVYRIGKSLPISLRCTLGGLGESKTSFEIRSNLAKQ